MDIKNKLNQFRNLSFINSTRRIILATTVVIISILSIVYILDASMGNKLTIMPFGSQKTLTDMGYSDIVCSTDFLNEINVISLKAEAVYGKNSPEILKKKIKVQTTFFGSETTIGKVKAFINYVLKIKPNIVNGNIRKIANDTIMLTSTYNYNPAIRVRGTLTNIDKLVKESAEHQYKYISPFTLATYFYAKKEDLKSIEAIKYSIPINSIEENKWSYNLWGTILMKYKLYKWSRRKLMKSIILDSTFYMAYHNMGILERLDSNYTKAEKYSKKAISLKQHFEEPYINLAEIYMAKNDFINAEEYINKAIKIGPKNSKTYFVKAKLMWKQKNKESAIDYLDTAIELNNDKSKYYFLMALIKKVNNEKESAKQLFNKAILLEKYSPEQTVKYLDLLSKEDMDLMGYENAKDYIKNMKAEKDNEKDYVKNIKEYLIH
ncbi:MAG: hypothetical protein KAG96_04540 [Ichthyobacteriaceae bacterium]|nr:hypothetical protein [Ichthyobacteriaceae bacterium]